MKTFCLGTGHIPRCETCLHHANWMLLNELPDDERKAKQATMCRIRDDTCGLTKCAPYIENKGMASSLAE